LGKYLNSLSLSTNLSEKKAKKKSLPHTTYGRREEVTY
jgi:hypothetical protein